MSTRTPDGDEPGPGAPDLGAPDLGASGADTGGGELRPLPYDGVRSVAVGTVIWLVALLAMLPFTDDLRADGRLWWIATAAVGFGLGLAGVWVVVRRRDRLRAAGERADPA
ncbi:Protein of unknown function (DUF2530) [Frankia sp. EI5c]|nr:Protein of unknown function (DUF2530) [Frankia sp. EI5c]OAA20507.1 Protein of unknown function (DUF2530) [Frankia sp. EI5c]